MFPHKSRSFPNRVTFGLDDNGAFQCESEFECNWLIFCMQQPLSAAAVLVVAQLWVVFAVPSNKICSADVGAEQQTLVVAPAGVAAVLAQRRHTFAQQTCPTIVIFLGGRPA